MKQLNWRQRPLSNKIELFSESKNIGKMITSSLFKKQEGEINGKRFIFNSRGLLFNKFQILNYDDKTVVGEIKYKYLSYKGLIILNSGQSFFWHLSKPFKKGWTISDAKDTFVLCQGLGSTGKITFEESSDVLVLAGLYIVSCYIKACLFLMILFVIFCTIAYNS